MKKIIKTPLTYLMMLWLLSASPVMGKTTEDSQIWGSVTAIGHLDTMSPTLKNFKYWLEGQARFGDGTSLFSQGILRTGLGFDVNKNTSIWLGYAWIPTDEPFTKNSFNENRVWQQLLWSKKYAHASIMSRSRLEQRFIPAGTEVGWRARQFFKASFPLSFAPSYTLVMSEEVFINLNSTNWGANDGFDQNRIFTGIGFNFDKNIKTEVGYINQYILKATGPNQMNHILSVNFFLSFN